MKGRIYCILKLFKILPLFLFIMGAIIYYMQWNCKLKCQIELLVPILV